MTFLTAFLEMFDFATDVNNVQIYKKECNGCDRFDNIVGPRYRKFYFHSQYSLITVFFFGYSKYYNKTADFFVHNCISVTLTILIFMKNYSWFQYLVIVFAFRLYYGKNNDVKLFSSNISLWFLFRWTCWWVATCAWHWWYSVLFF